MHVNQQLPTVVVAYAGYVGRLALQERNELSAMIELVEPVLASLQAAKGVSFLELGVKVDDWLVNTRGPKTKRAEVIAPAAQPCASLRTNARRRRSA